MKMLRWISRNRRKYRIQDEKTHLKIRMTPIDERWKESCLRWFGLVQRRERLLHQWGKVSWVKLNEWMKICRGRPKIALVEVVENDMSIKEITENITSYWIEWPKIYIWSSQMHEHEHGHRYGYKYNTMKQAIFEKL